jgi:hypothetical protein
VSILRVAAGPAALLALLAAPPPGGATEYHVGPGQPLTAIAQVPWATLVPGDRVLIHWRASPYREKWVIDRRGTAAAPIVILGVPGPGGELPVIAGDGATTPTNLDYWNQERGVIKIGGSNMPPDALPAYLVVEGLEVRSGRPPYTFTDASGSVQTYADNAASIYVEKAEHLVIRGCVLDDSGNGLFVGAYDGATRDVAIEANWIHDNGIDASAYEHNTYTSAIGIVYQYNRFGPLRPGADGNNLKDRSAGLVVRDNWIEGGNRQLDLVDADSPVQVADPSYRETFVYGNVLIEPDGAGNSQIVHYGGDGGDPANYRKGTLYFYDNTLVSTRSGNTTLLRLSTADESADARDNVLYVTAAGSALAMIDDTGTLALSHNWTKPGWVECHCTPGGTVIDDGTGIEGASPGFVDEAGQDFRLAAGSQALDAGGPLAPPALPEHAPLRQYFRHLRSTPRGDDGAPDLGAFERCLAGQGPCGPIFVDGFESGGADRWSAVGP